MTFDEAKAKFSTEAVCPACRHVGKRRPFYLVSGQLRGFMQWDCDACGHPAYSDTSEPTVAI